jgi:hypothetical protein
LVGTTNGNYKEKDKTEEQHGDDVEFTSKWIHDFYKKYRQNICIVVYIESNV